MKATKDNLIQTVAKADRKRRVNAVQELPNYQLLTAGALRNTKTGKIYHPTHWNAQKGCWCGCDCPDAQTHIKTLREEMTEANVVAPLSCKHHHLRKLLSGQEIRIDNTRIRAKAKK